MERKNNYPIEIKAKVDLNTELLLNELSRKLRKNRSQIIRLILSDFFNRNMKILEENLNRKIDR